MDGGRPDTERLRAAVRDAIGDDIVLDDVPAAAPAPAEPRARAPAPAGPRRSATDILSAALARGGKGRARRALTPEPKVAPAAEAAAPRTEADRADPAPLEPGPAEPAVAIPAEDEADFRRRVFYVPGYDPHPARRYRELYRTEGARQAQLSGFEIAQRARSGEGFGWTVGSDQDGWRVRTDVDVLAWSDIVRSEMSASIPMTYWRLMRTAWTYGASGALPRLARLRKGPVIAALYPVAMLLAQLALALIAGQIVGGLLSWGLGALLGLVGLSAPLATGFVWLAGLVAVAAVVLRWFKAKDGKLFAHYLMTDYAFTAARNGANPPALEGRIAAFAERVAAALDEDWDEVLVVGHSSGAHVGASVVADVIRSGAARPDGPALSFLTLGQCIPMVSFLPDAARLRGDLNYLAQRPELTWVDVTAPGDGCAFALCDPVAVSGVAPPDGGRGPLVISAAFQRTLAPRTWRALRWRFFRLHFQYLCAFDALSGREDEFDYFRVTAGALTLHERFGQRAPSPARIDLTVSPHVTMAAPAPA